MPNQKDLQKKRDELKKQLGAIDEQLAAIDTLEKTTAAAEQEFDTEMQAQEKEIETVYKEEADKLNAAMIDDARSALKE